MHLTRLQHHLVSGTKNDPLPETNLCVKVVSCVIQFLLQLDEADYTTYA